MRLPSGLVSFTGLPFATTIRANLSKFSNSVDGFGIVILVRGLMGPTIYDTRRPTTRTTIERGGPSREP